MTAGEEIRRVRQALGGDQTKFGARFEVTRRSVIRWEKSGHRFRWWGGWYREDGKAHSDLWLDAVKASSPKAKAARRRKRTKKSVAAIKRRRPVVKGKTGRARR